MFIKIKLFPVKNIKLVNKKQWNLHKNFKQNPTIWRHCQFKHVNRLKSNEMWPQQRLIILSLHFISLLKLSAIKGFKDMWLEDVPFYSNCNKM